jgi:hypothetical protein
LQKLLQAQRRIERNRFLRHDLAGNSSAIPTAVARIDHNRRKRNVCSRVGDHYE